MSAAEYANLEHIEGANGSYPGERERFARAGGVGAGGFAGEVARLLGTRVPDDRAESARLFPARSPADRVSYPVGERVTTFRVTFPFGVVFC